MTMKYDIRDLCDLPVETVAARIGFFGAVTPSSRGALLRLDSAVDAVESVGGRYIAAAMRHQTRLS